MSLEVLAYDAAPPPPDLPRGDIRTHADFHSRVLDNRRTVLVYLPPGYDAAPERRYPVLYLHDGQNLFDGATAYIYGQDWRVGQTAQALIEAGAIEPLVIVGVYNMGHGRVDEYTPSYDRGRNMGGRADAYGRMLVEELKPFVDANYRTRTEASATGLGGSSLGGLVTLYLGLRRPQTFTRLAALSPSVFWGGRQIIREVEQLQGRPPLRIWLDTGTAEGWYVTEHARALRDALVIRGWTHGHDLHYLEAHGAEHNELAWAARVAPMLKFLFPRV
ncbi:MAG TPA: alpha/beta hydrolase-fold protein [Pyrinomonadaceae bacterium]